MATKLNARNVQHIITQLDSPIKAAAWFLLSVAVSATVPLWLSPLIGITVLQGYIVFGTHVLVGVIMGQVLKLRALTLIVRRSDTTE